MSYNDETTFNKENLDLYLKALGKEFRRLNGKATPADIILIRGGTGQLWLPGHDGGHRRHCQGFLRDEGCHPKRRRSV